MQQTHHIVRPFASRLGSFLPLIDVQVVVLLVRQCGRIEVLQRETCLWADTSSVGWVQGQHAAGPQACRVFMVVHVPSGRLWLDEQGDHPKQASSVGDATAHNMPSRLGTHEPPWSRWAVSAGAHLRKGLEQLLLFRLGPALPPPCLNSTAQLARQAAYGRFQEQWSGQVTSRFRGAVWYIT